MAWSMKDPPLELSMLTQAFDLSSQETEAEG